MQKRTPSLTVRPRPRQQRSRRCDVLAGATICPHNSPLPSLHAALDAQCYSRSAIHAVLYTQCWTRSAIHAVAQCWPPRLPLPCAPLRAASAPPPLLPSAPSLPPAPAADTMASKEQSSRPFSPLRRPWICAFRDDQTNRPVRRARAIDSNTQRRWGAILLSSAPVPNKAGLGLRLPLLLHLFPPLLQLQPPLLLLLLLSCLTSAPKRTTQRGTAMGMRRNATRRCCGSVQAPRMHALVQRRRALGGIFCHAPRRTRPATLLGCPSAMPSATPERRRQPLS